MMVNLSVGGVVMVVMSESRYDGWEVYQLSCLLNLVPLERYDGCWHLWSWDCDVGGRPEWELVSWTWMMV